MGNSFSMRGLGNLSFLSILTSAFLSLFWRFSSRAFTTIGSALDFAFGPGALRSTGVACMDLASVTVTAAVTGETIGGHPRPISLLIIILKGRISASRTDAVSPLYHNSDSSFTELSYIQGYIFIFNIFGCFSPLACRLACVDEIDDGWSVEVDTAIVLHNSRNL